MRGLLGGGGVGGVVAVRSRVRTTGGGVVAALGLLGVVAAGAARLGGRAAAGVVAAAGCRFRRFGSALRACSSALTAGCGAVRVLVLVTDSVTVAGAAAGWA